MRVFRVGIRVQGIESSVPWEKGSLSQAGVLHVDPEVTARTDQVWHVGSRGRHRELTGEPRLTGKTGEYPREGLPRPMWTAQG